MKRAIWNDPITSATCIFTPAYNDEIRPKALTDDEWFDAAVLMSVPPSAAFSVIDCANPEVAAVLFDRTFRDAWVVEGGNLQVDMPKARDIHMARIRVVRDVELTRLDVPFIRALEEGDAAEQNRIKEVKQALREIPGAILPLLDASKTPEELNQVWPSNLDVRIKDVKKAL